MRRITFFESDFEDIISRTELDDRVRWYEPRDRATLVARNITAQTLDWFLDNGGRIAVLEADGQVVAWILYSFVDEPH